jgi:hypothetical protein
MSDFLPSNVTKLYQPIDVGVIETMKRKYQCELLLIELMKEGQC